MAATIVQARPTPFHHRRRGHPRRYARRRRARFRRRAAGVRSSPPSRLATPSCWLAGGFGTVCLVGLEGLAVTAPGLPATSPRLASGRRGGPLGPPGPAPAGQSDSLHAVSAARSAQSGRARGAPSGPDGAAEAIRALMVARRSAAGERTRTINQARASIPTGPDDLRTVHPHTSVALVAGLAPPRPRPGHVASYAVRVALRELGRRAQFLTASSAAWTISSSRWSPPAPRPARPVRDRAPHRGAAAHRRRGPSRAAPLRGGLAHLCGAAPIPHHRERHPPPAQSRR